jgi:hypothetical protein
LREVVCFKQAMQLALAHRRDSRGIGLSRYRGRRQGSLNAKYRSRRLIAQV